MSSGSSWSWLYPKRSITSHRFCGSGRLFRGFKDEVRRAESGMAELVVADYAINPDAGKDMRPLFRCQGNIAEWANIVRHIAKRVEFWASEAENIAKRAKLDAHPAKTLLGMPVRKRFNRDCNC